MSAGNLGVVVNLMQGIVSAELAASRSNQGMSNFVWHAREALARADFASTLNARVSLPVLNSTAVITTTSAAANLIGVVIDNNEASNDAYVQVFNTGTVTLGTTNALGVFLCKSGRMIAYVCEDPVVFGTTLVWDATTTAFPGTTRNTAATVKVSLVYTG